MIKDLRYYAERMAPYVISFVAPVILWRYDINYIENGNFNDAIDGVNTVAALIIGFLGAMLPVILGMKNESKFVQYVFEKDKNKLFLKNIKSNLLTGLLLVALSISLYFRDDFEKNLKARAFYVWVYMCFLFFSCTYRSLSNMLELVFSDDKIFHIQSSSGNAIKSAQEKELEDEFDDQK